jgi:sulfur carrier protein
VIVVNGESAEFEPGGSLASVLRDLGVSARARGVAVAVDGEVVPRTAWETFTLADNARVEVLTAMQGG